MYMNKYVYRQIYILYIDLRLLVCTRVDQSKREKRTLQVFDLPVNSQTHIELDCTRIYIDIW